jgi:hypothetical protein
MDLDDFWEPEVAVAAGVVATVAAPRARHVMRQGAVYGLAGLMIAGDRIAGMARGVKSAARQTATPPAAREEADDIWAEARSISRGQQR